MIKKYFPFIVIIFLVILFHWRLVFLREIFAHSDVFISFYPMKAFASESLKNLAVPLWNPYWFMGHPALAESQTGFFYPINLILFYLFPTHIAYNLSTIIHYILAGMFTYLFARKLNMERLPSLLSAITFTFSGFYVTHTFHIWANQSAVWLPLLFLLVEKIYDSVCNSPTPPFIKGGREGIVWSSILGLTLGVHFLIGHYQIQIINTMAVAVYFILRINLLKNIKTTGLFIFSLIISIGISTIQWLPSLEASQFSGRGAGLSSEWAYNNSFHPLHFITFIFPYFFGYSISGYFGNPYWGFGSLWEICGYVGILPLIFAIISIVFLRDMKAVRNLSILAGIFMLLAMGKYGLIYIPLHHLPVIKAFMNPGRFLIAVTLPISILAGFGFQYLYKIQDSMTHPLDGCPKIQNSQLKTCNLILATLLLTSFGIILSLNLGSFLLRDYIQSFETGIISKIGKHYDNLGSVFIITNPRVFLQLAIILASVIIVRTGLKSGWGRSLKSFVVVLVIADLFYFGIGYNPPTDSRIYTEEPKSVKLVLSESEGTDKPLFRIYSWNQGKLIEDGFKKDGKYHYEDFREIIPASSNILYGLQHVFGSASLSSRRNLELIWMDKIKEIPTGSENLLKYPKIMDMLNIKYVLSSEDIFSDNLDLIHEGIVKVYKNKYVLPRVYFVQDYKVIQREEDIIKEMKGNDFDPQKYAILEENPPQFHPLTKGDKEGFSGNNVIITDYKNESVKLMTDMKKGGLLILGDTWYPGWKAFVDGLESKIYRVNYIQRGVFLKKGKHDIEFSYAPQSFIIGKFITFFTLVITIPAFIYNLLLRTKPNISTDYTDLMIKK